MYSLAISKGVLFRLNNAPVNSLAITMAVINDDGFDLIEHSPDIAPSDFHLFIKL